MPWIPLYSTKADLEALATTLAANEDLALLVRDEDYRWRAIRKFDLTNDDRYGFWHIPSGPLPNPAEHEMGPPADWVDSPFDGWTPHRIGERGLPYFGAGHPGIFWLNLRTVDPRDPDAIGLSSIEWIGNHYAMIGQSADAATMRRWQKLKRDIAKIAPKIPRGGLQPSGKTEICAFPDATAQIGQGRRAGISP